MDIEVEFALEVVRTKLSKTKDRLDAYLACDEMGVCLLSFVPGDYGRKADLVHAREEGEECENERRYEEFPLVEEL